MNNTSEPSSHGIGADSHKIKFKSFKITKVERVENPSLWDKYALKRDDMLKSTGTSSPSSPPPSHVNICQAHLLATFLKSEPRHTMHGLHTESVGECYLFHGTSLTAVDAIVSTGFDPRLGRGFFGQGCYFAENLSKSDQYCRESGDDHVMFLCRVLVGQPHIMLQPKRDTVRPRVS